ncbi:MAG: DUF1934 domain-containing protein [Butyrivibrio sp.]|uniref:DUF1934 domain-containing protein n=1 Tax=Butyrivibrio sp. NC2002 TaxID=1410610 RepID=UPI00055B6418|nr:DUF1934 domain-containing protein [Butyrivibrio sp. NC2002]MBE5859989.1 DUF1934 domain-containing protein [Butyrivibrio sp.]
MNGTIRIMGSHNHGDGTPEIIKETANALLEINEDKYVISYETTNEGNKISHIIEIDGTNFTMIQEGAVNSTLVFGPGKVYNTDYHTPYGIMKMSVITRNIMAELGSKKITAHVQYELLMDGSKVSDSKVRISFIPD